ncbi:MAG: ABC transporter permease [Archangium sp.]|nr:ABC transporter permease [Archangium sp.]MDP3157331.1 ABC transporter permease [Archangium sp.]MDP3571169.1 ABC transporter permease [Archangium sp.]
MKPAWRILLGKELLDVARDRRTLVLTVLLPVLLYPGILLLMGAIVAAGTQRLKNEPLVVAVVGQATAELLARKPVPEKTTFQAQARAEAERLLRDQQIAALVEAPQNAAAELEAGRQVVVTILYTKRFDRSVEALDRLRPVLESINTDALELRLEARQLEPGFVQPVKADAVDLEFQKDLGPLIASRLLPIVLLMMLILGALYPAVDLTAGEKERGTLETLLVSGARPVDVMAAKYLTVSAVAVVTALANLAAMAATFGFGLSFGGKATTTFQLSGGQMLTMLACLVPAALLLAGVSLTVASTARTFKEGQSLMSPLMLVCLAPALLSQMPGVELNNLTALIPLLNVALLIKASVLGNATLTQVVLTMGSVLLFALIALKVAAKAFNSEVFRFGGTEGWRALFGESKSAARQSKHR